MPRTIREFQLAMRDVLAHAGLQAAPMEVDWMLQAATGLSRAVLLARGDDEVSEAVRAQVEAGVRRRLRREPLQYILGETGFYGRTFLVTPDVLIPRPETELLVECTLAVLGGAGQRVLDIGTGSGCVACSVALEAPQSDVMAMDVSQRALAIARKNASQLKAPVTFLEADLFDDGQMAGVGGPFDVVVSNPPYVPDADGATLEPELSHEPALALFTRGDTLRFVRRLAVMGRRLLRPGGSMFQEIHAPESDGVLRVIEAAGFEEVRTYQDLAGRPRVVGGRQPSV